MKKILLFIFSLLMSSSIFPQQYYYTFSELKGMEDNSGNTHLFYRLYYYEKGGGPLSDSYGNSIYHLNLGNNGDSLFLYTGRDHLDLSYIVSDVEFWNNDPSKYIYCGAHGYTDGTAFIQRYDQDESSVDELGGASAIEISNQNDSLIFASVNSILLKSINGGIVWDTANSTFYKQLISVNPFNDSVLFANEYSNGLYKSTDGGSNFSVADTFQTDIKQFFYDKDEIHIYRVVNYQGENFLSVSNNKGNAFSWTQKYNSENKIFISIDNSQSGSIYLADRNYIYYSNDYGENFSLFKKLERKIVGIYKKPNSNKLYAATKYDLYEITSNSIKTIKHLQINPEIFSWFPLHVGDKWIYNYTFTSESEVTHSINVRRISKKFFYKNKEYYGYYRIDSTSGKIYRAYFVNDSLINEELFLDLTAEVGDTIPVGNGIYLESETQFSDFGIKSTQKNFKSVLTPYIDLRIVKDLGIFYDLTWELVGSESQLKGAVINGIVYGDTTLTGIEESENIPASFSLSQNYPNPFNPSTKIKYSIPNVETRHASSVQVMLKIYDILGREIITLVNQEQNPGNYEVEFSGSGLPSGIYFYKLSAAPVDEQAGDFNQTRKMILLK